MTFSSATISTKFTTIATTSTAFDVVVVLVDTSEAGLGDLDIDVICKDTRVPTQSQPIGRCHNRYTFVPLLPHNHIVNIKYNFDDVPGTMLRISRLFKPTLQGH